MTAAHALQSLAILLQGAVLFFVARRWAWGHSPYCVCEDCRVGAMQRRIVAGRWP